VLFLNLHECNSYARYGSRVHHCSLGFKDVAIMNDLNSDPRSRWRAIPWDDMASKEAQVPGLLS